MTKYPEIEFGRGPLAKHLNPSERFFLVWSEKGDRGILHSYERKGKPMWGGVVAWKDGDRDDIAQARWGFDTREEALEYLDGILRDDYGS